MTPAQRTLKAFTAGDHFPGIPLITIKVNGSAPSSALASARLRFQKHGTSTVVELLSSNGKISIQSNANWQLTVPKQAVPGLTAGRWNWNLETTSAAGVVETYLAGNQNVFEDV